jgi:hypothetical protein
MVLFCLNVICICLVYVKRYLTLSVVRLSHKFSVTMYRVVPDQEKKRIYSIHTYEKFTKHIR